MRAALIQNGYVVNVLEVDSLDFMPGLVECKTGNIGDSYVNGSIIPKPGPTEDDIKELRRAELMVQITALETGSLLNRGSRELELICMQDLATRQAAILQPSMPGRTIEEIANEIMAKRPYFTKLLALNKQVTTLRLEMEAL